MRETFAISRDKVGAHAMERAEEISRKFPLTRKAERLRGRKDFREELEASKRSVPDQRPKIRAQRVQFLDTGLFFNLHLLIERQLNFTQDSRLIYSGLPHFSSVGV